MERKKRKKGRKIRGEKEKGRERGKETKRKEKKGKYERRYENQAKDKEMRKKEYKIRTEDRTGISIEHLCQTIQTILMETQKYCIDP